MSALAPSSAVLWPHQSKTPSRSQRHRV